MAELAARLSGSWATGRRAPPMEVYSRILFENELGLVDSDSPSALTRWEH